MLAYLPSLHVQPITAWFSHNFSVGLAQNLTADSTLEDFLGTMAALPWNTDLARSLQDTVLESEEKTFCDTATVSSLVHGYKVWYRRT